METRRAGVQHLLVMKEEEDATEQQECSSSLDQEGQEPPLIKEEPEEEDLDQIKEEATQFSLTPVQVKSEDDGATSSWTQHMKTEADGDTCGGAEAASDLDTPLLPDHQRSPCSDTVDSEDWRETIDPESASNSLICSGCGRKCSSKSELIGHMKSCSGSLSCSVCGKSFEKKRDLKIHMRLHTGDAPYNCSYCGERFTQRETKEEHMKLHAGEKPFRCSQCVERVSHFSGSQRQQQKDKTIHSPPRYI
ncbi:zinc finger and SCAN domain-containing protein 23-like [Synchiropus splendidus]|uniref:zinc finger and SCAN domain-containing protein 23-like n=1 Tax=Synchiropus splendidus TaxID=270530 RepID=UPI00237EB4B2|nr:zinc finger and SCAN domain-containing protein 23-like [Synchiropus splendidus]